MTPLDGKLIYAGGSHSFTFILPVTTFKADERISMVADQPNFR